MWYVIDFALISRILLLGAWCENLIIFDACSVRLPALGLSFDQAADIATKLCDSVLESLVGKKLGSFSSVRSVARTAMEEALLRILTPRRPVDVLHGVASAKEQGRPYVVVFCGVNGVGKSTSLAKITNFLQAHSFSVGIVACDTFRAGAVEQLRTHARCLGASLYEQGYDKDAALVAQAGIRAAKAQGADVVLVDTAGRMQNNDNLMKALAKLIHLNSPDLVLFVGEALVGNDGVDQLDKFNKALERECVDSSRPRGIDGIVLTKFDTIDDKVGAAISMTYISGQPILFVGTGQTYADLKRMNAKVLIKALLK
jgi:signal recognition particle receptor subunit alpha